MESQSEPIQPDPQLSIKYRDDYMLTVNCTSWCLFISVKGKTKNKMITKFTFAQLYRSKCELLTCYMFYLGKQ